MKMSLVGKMLGAVAPFTALVATVQAATMPPTPEKALEMLLEGNRHFVRNEIVHLSYLNEAKDKMLEQQTPFAAVVGCSDSRVPPRELIFDRGLGELFVVRDAGQCDWSD